VTPLVATTTQGRPYFSLVIGVKVGPSITTPTELKGKRFAYGDKQTLLQKTAVESMGLKSSDFSKFAYLKHYDNIAKAVLAGDFDGGILKDSVAADFRGKGIVVARPRCLHTSLPCITACPQPYMTSCATPCWN
jgi:phosphonate transport system substrate-binding protein